MKCQSVQDDLKAYGDGELPLRRRLAVRRHLSDCAVCREEVQVMATVQQELRAGEEKPDSLTPELRARIFDEVVGQGKAASAAPEKPRRPRVGGPAIAWGAAALVLLGWFILFPVLQPAREMARSVNPAGARDWSAAPSAPMAAPVGGGATSSAPAVQQMKRVQRPSADVSSPLAGLAAINDDASGTSLRRVHKEASLTVTVSNPETQSDAVEQMVKSSGGYVADNNLATDDGGRRSAQMSLKVPEPQFETILGQIAKLGEVQAKSITGQDITGQVSDASQAENVLETEVQQSQARLNKLGTKAKWEDDEQARDLRIQLAQLRARLQLLQKMAALSTISVTLNEKPRSVPTAAGGFFKQLTGTTHDALVSLASSAAALLTLFIWLLAYAPLWLPAALVTRYFLRLSQQRKATPHP